MMLIDANVFMYAAGAEHAHRAPSVALLRRVAADEIEAAIDAEVLREILHRYRALRRWEQGRRVYDLARRIVPLVLAIDGDVLDVARATLDDFPAISARDALHAAVVRTSGADVLCSYDTDFDAIPWVTRVAP